MSRTARSSEAGLGEGWGITSTAHDGGKRGAADVRVGGKVKGNESLVLRAGPVSKGGVAQEMAGGRGNDVQDAISVSMSRHENYESSLRSYNETAEPVAASSVRYSICASILSR
jgi:hypothetical protein